VTGVHVNTKLSSSIAREERPLCSEPSPIDTSDTREALHQTPVRASIIAACNAEVNEREEERIETGCKLKDNLHTRTKKVYENL
jgi:hypothetical protein